MNLLPYSELLENEHNKQEHALTNQGLHLHYHS